MVKGGVVRCNEAEGGECNCGEVLVVETNCGGPASVSARGHILHILFYSSPIGGCLDTSRYAENAKDGRGPDQGRRTMPGQG